MIIIKITNADDVLKQKVGRLAARLIHAVKDDVTPQIEKAVIEELEHAFVEFGIKANFYSVSGPDMLGNGKLEIPVEVHQQKFMS